MVKHDFYIGQAFDAYTFFGAHPENGGVTFRTYAPNAKRICVSGDWNGWTETEMIQEGKSGIFSCFEPEAQEGMLYKYRIYKEGDYMTEHADPYGFGMELRPNSASVIRNLDRYQFADEAWMKRRTELYDQPLNIYEMHLGSWKKKSDEETGWYTYAEIADELISYVKENHYNYIEFMPLSEHPADCSWGYQNTGFFSPTSRYGTADELMELVDKCHQAGIGVIMDFVPVHFAIDYYGLAKYDGTWLYEYPHEDVGVSEWGSYNFIHSRGEVRSFLQSAANYWLEKYHFDGIRMDAISRIIYWQGDEGRGVNRLGIDFVKTMNAGLKRRHPGVILAAEDSTSFADVTKPAEAGGLGFDYKWDMGWMNDTLDYFKKPTEERTKNYHKLTFSMMYFYNERYLLPLSHDEVVHGKATIIQKMYGDYEDKFRQARAFYMYMYSHPGKKLNFMGNEFGQFREWDETREQDWLLLDYPAHDGFYEFMKELKRIYLEYDALSYQEYSPSSFRWIDCHQEERCIYAFERKGRAETIIAVMNFSGLEQKKYFMPCQEETVIRPLLHSDWDIYGGAMKKNARKLKAQKGASGYQIVMDLPAYSSVFYLVESK